MSGKFKEQTKVLMKRFNYDADVDRGNLSKEMARVSSFIFRIGVVKAEAEAKVDKAKARIDVIKAKAGRRIKRKALDKGDKLTVHELNAKIDCSKQVQEAIQDHIDRKFDHNVCWAAANSASAKANQLTNISMNYRKELDAGISSKVKEQRAGDKVSRLANKSKGR